MSTPDNFDSNEARKARRLETAKKRALVEDETLDPHANNPRERKRVPIIIRKGVIGTVCSAHDCYQEAIYYMYRGYHQKWACPDPQCKKEGIADLWGGYLLEDEPPTAYEERLRILDAPYVDPGIEVTPKCEADIPVAVEIDTGVVRAFISGATRDTAEGKFDYEGFLHPGVLERFAEYMDANRLQSDGNIRDSDNWQKGIPREQYMKSMWRHFMEVWSQHRAGLVTGDTVDEDALCALLFNVMGYMFEQIMDR